MNSAGTYEADIEVRKVGLAIPGLRVFCDGRKRESRQGVGVGVLGSVLYRKMDASRKSTNGTVGLLLISYNTKPVVLSGLESFSSEERV